MCASDGLPIGLQCSPGGTLLVILLACRPPPSGDDRVLFTDLGGPTGETAETGEPGPPGLELELLDYAGEPGASWDVSLLAPTLDLMLTTDAQGRVVVEDLLPGNYALHPYAPEGLATPLGLLSLEEGERQEVLLQVPLLDLLAVLGEAPAYVQVGAGLQVQAARGELVPAPFAPEVDALAGVRVDPERWPPLDGLAAEPLAVWYLDPFDATAPSGLPVRVTEPLGLLPGERARVWVASYPTATWLDAGALVSDGATLTGEALLPRLSTVVVTRE
jgi:hypothetical protein